MFYQMPQYGMYSPQVSSSWNYSPTNNSISNYWQNNTSNLYNNTSNLYNNSSSFYNNSSSFYNNSSTINYNYYLGNNIMNQPNTGLGMFAGSGMYTPNTGLGMFAGSGMYTDNYGTSMFAGAGMFGGQPFPSYTNPYAYTDPYGGMFNNSGMSGIMEMISALMALFQGGSGFYNDDDVIFDYIRAWGDPHFEMTNSKGELLTTDHKGIDGHTYNILDTSKGDGLVVDAKYVPFTDPDNPQVMGTVRVASGNDELLFDRDGNATLNGQALEAGKEYHMEDGTKIVYKEDGNIDVTSKEGDATINLMKQDGYLDVGIAEGSKLGNGNQKIGGVIGALYENRDNLAAVDSPNGRITDINGDGISDDLNGSGFIEDDEWARLGYNFDVTNRRAIA